MISKTDLENAIKLQEFMQEINKKFELALPYMVRIENEMALFVCPLNKPKNNE